MSGSLIVQKYGGMSLATREGVLAAARRIADTARAGHRVVAAVSARGTATDDLLALALEFSSAPSPRETDALLASAEQASAALLALAVTEAGVPALSLSAHQNGILTTEEHGHAKVAAVDTSRLAAALEAGKVVVVSGFVGLSGTGDITTLGRGGTDKTAVVLAHALGADRCEVYKEVLGVATADPRRVPAAGKIDAVTFDEMLELSATGARVLQADAVEIAKRFGVPIHLRPVSGAGTGTFVGAALERADVVGATLSTEESVITLSGVPDRPGRLRDIFQAVAERSVNVDTILVSPSLDGVSQVSFSIPLRELAAALAACEDLRARIGFTGMAHQEPVAKISIVGVGMQHRHGVAARMFRALAQAGVNILIVTTTEIKVTCAVDAADGEKGLRAVHAAFGLGGERALDG
jgi:aspartate kinase